jgi:hypothetical protein
LLYTGFKRTMSVSGAGTYIIKYDEQRFRNELKCVTKTKKTKDGETYNLVTHKRNGHRSGYAYLGKHIHRDMFMKIAIQELKIAIQELMKKSENIVIPYDIVNYIMSFISYPSDEEVRSYNMEIYINVFMKNSIYESAIFNEKGYMVCVAPSKSMYSSVFCHRFKHDFKNIVFFEMVEGDKINAFYHNGKWRLATKYVIDDESYNIIKNFRDACENLNVDMERDLDKRLCYSFIYQVPYISYVNSFLYTYEIYIVAVQEIDNDENTLINLDLREFEHVSPYYRGKYKKNLNIMIPNQLFVNFEDLELIVKEWGPGDGLPSEIWEDDPNEGRYLQHNRGEKGIVMCHMPTGIYSNVYNRNYLHYLIGDKLNNV